MVNSTAELFIIMASSNGDLFHVTVPLWGESIGHRWIPLTKASDAELCSFHWSAPEQTIEQTIEMPVIWHHQAHYVVTVMFGIVSVLAADCINGQFSVPTYNIG